MFKISVFGLSSVFYTSCTKKEPYPFIGKTHKFKNLLNLMTLGFDSMDPNSPEKSFLGVNSDNILVNIHYDATNKILDLDIRRQ